MLSSVEKLDISTMQNFTTFSPLCSKYRSVFKAVIFQYIEKNTGVR